MRANLDGSNIETLVDTSEGDPTAGAMPGNGASASRWTPPEANLLDPERERQRRPGPHFPREYRASAKARRRPIAKDIELLYDNLPEPIDLDLDLDHRVIYWTDRGDPPRGNTVNRAPMDPPPGNRKAPEIVFSHLMEGIGMALDLKGGRMFITDFAGSVYSANLDGSNKKTLLFAQGNLTGIAYAEI